MQIAERTVALFNYTLTNAAGDVVDSSDGREPLAYLHGTGNIVPGLEKEMAGKKAGDKFNVVVQPEDGYGVPNPIMIQVVPAAAFQGVDTLEVGMEFQAQTPQRRYAGSRNGIPGANTTRPYVGGGHQG